MRDPTTGAPRRGPAPAEPADAPAAAVGADGATAPAVTPEPATGVGEPSGAPLAGDVAGRRHRLPLRAIRYWRWRAFYSALPVVVLLVGLALFVPWGPWWLLWGVAGVFVAVVTASIIILPPIRYRVFWYAISPTEIDIQYGVVFVKRSVVPMHRVQNLRTERGPVADHYRITNLKIRTAAGSVSLGGLDRGVADELCDRISQLTSLTDDV